MTYRRDPRQTALMTISAINLDAKFHQFSDTWSPKVVARLNDYEVKLVRLDGEFVWHSHDDTDELFLVLEGELTIQLRDGNVGVRAGELFVVPRGLEHCPITAGEVRAMLIEPRGVVNTGTAGGTLTAESDDSLA
jgi:mannose-6-phosphate isomerase-like protein (cupin superfamily)